MSNSFSKINLANNDACQDDISLLFNLVKRLISAMHVQLYQLMGNLAHSNERKHHIFARYQALCPD